MKTSFCLASFRLSDVLDGGALNLEVVWVPIKNYLDLAELRVPENENWVPQKGKSSDVHICHAGTCTGRLGWLQPFYEPQAQSDGSDAVCAQNGVKVPGREMNQASR